MKKAAVFILSLILVCTGLKNHAQFVSRTPETSSTDDSRDWPFVWAEVMDNDSWCQVNWSPPVYTLLQYYDDGEADDYALWQNPGSVNAVKFTPSGYPAYIMGGKFYVGDGSFPGPFLGTSFLAAVYDDDGTNGLPGTLLDSMTVEVTNYGWVQFYFPSPVSSIEDGSYYLGMMQTDTAPDAAPLGVDTDNPTYNLSYSKFGTDDWMLSPYQDYMVRAEITGDSTLNDSIDYYEVARFSNFDPNGPPEVGDTTVLDTTFVYFYNDFDWAGLPQGYFAYGIKSHYTEGGWSDYAVSNVVGHMTSFDFTICITACDPTAFEYGYVFVQGGNISQTFSIPPNGCITIENFEGSSVYIYAYVPGNLEYVLDDILVSPDLTIGIALSCILFPIESLYVDPLTSKSTWNAPRVSMLNEDFEQDNFPPQGWQEESNGNGWFGTVNGSGGGWNIPAWNSKYACTNDILNGSGNDGSMDYLVTPCLHLDYRDNYQLNFHSFYDGSNGEIATLEYSFDGGATWSIYEIISPTAAWSVLPIDLSPFSGYEGDPVMFAFHADDQGQDASGWAVDNVEIYSPEPPNMLEDYYIYLDDSLIAIADTNAYTVEWLTYGQQYEICVAAHYPSGLSQKVCYTFESQYLVPPSCFYQADTGQQPLILCPPLDSLGQVPDNFVAYNIYLGGSYLWTLPPETTSYLPIGFTFQPGVYQFGVFAVYDLTTYGFPGQTDESAMIVTPFVVRWGYDLDFAEDWTEGNFDEQNWNTDAANWSINSQMGIPAPSAEFTWDPIQTDYALGLESYPMLGDSLFNGQIYLEFDINLANVNPTSNERFLVQVWNWSNQSWNTAYTFTNSESFAWSHYKLDISEYALGQVFKVRFLATGDNSLDILGWYVDNIQVYRICNPVTNPYAHIDSVNPCIKLEWDPPTTKSANRSLDYYDIYKMEPEGGLYEWLARVDSGQTSYCDYDYINWNCYMIKAVYTSQDDTCTSAFSEEACQYVSVTENSKNHELIIYPNPVRDFLHLESTQWIRSIELINSLGEAVMFATPESYSTRLDIERLTEGLYYLRLETEHGMTSKKIIVLR